jgi:hypothetical protein
MNYATGERADDCARCGCLWHHCQCAAGPTTSEEQSTRARATYPRLPRQSFIADLPLSAMGGVSLLGHERSKWPRRKDFVNYAPSTRGRVVAICECCGRRSRPTSPNADGEPSLFEGFPGPGRGWSEAPYSHSFRHDDGSVGSTWTCPACNKRLRAGEALTLRDYEPGTRRPGRSP